MLGMLLAGVVVVICAVLLFAASRPGECNVARSVSIQAGPERIFPFINDLRRWSAWSPWERKDPGMKRTWDGPASGAGAIYAWDGNRDVGAGRMEIVDAESPSRVAIRLEFLRPLPGRSHVEFLLRPKDEGTEVVWSFRGPRPFIAKIVGLFIDVNKMIATDFDAGLARLKSISEA